MKEKNLVFCEITGVLTEKFIDSNDKEHIRDFDYIDESINNLKKLVEETNSLLVIVRLGRWATTEEYNNSRVSRLEKDYKLHIDGFLDVSYDYQCEHHYSVYDEAPLVLMDKWICSNKVSINKMAYIRQGGSSPRYNVLGNGVFTLSLSSKQGITKQCLRCIKQFLLEK